MIVDHDSGGLIWAAPGREKKTLHTFFDALGKSRSAKLKEVSVDGADWIAEVVHARCLNAKMNMDAFHTVVLCPIEERATAVRDLGLTRSSPRPHVFPGGPPSRSRRTGAHRRGR